MEAILQVVLVSFIYWCADEKKGLRLAVVLPISAWINLALTNLFDRHSAFFTAYDPSAGRAGVIMWAGSSVHAQNLLVMLIIIASWKIIPPLSRAVHFCIAALLSLLTGFCGIYFGVFSLTDIFSGWLIGGLILLAYFALGKRIEAWFEAHSPRAGLLAAAVLAFTMNMYRPSEYMLIPGGMILGLGIGCYLCHRYLGFTASLKDRTGTAKRLTLLVRYSLGITAMALLYVATGKAINGIRDSGNYHLYIFTRYVLASVWFSAGAPWIFCKLRLA